VGTSRDYPSLVLRPPTPPFLRRFVIDLYGGRCLRCGIDRPLEVAHVASWPVVRDSAMQQPGPDQEGTARLRFHQPENLVLLCSNCHTLFDDPNVAEVDQRLMFSLRDRALAVPHFGECVRAFVCREMAGSRRRRPVSDAALAPLFDWLQTAVERGTLPPPHRFTVPWGKAFWLIDLAASDCGYENEADPSLPRWDGKGFVNPPAPSPGAAIA
jgi:HNH endonuclease